jgi:Domain of unknown function (DUF3512).
MVDNLLDLLTGGEHRKTKRILEERRKFREEEERIRQLLEGKAVSLQGMSDDKLHSLSAFTSDIKVDFGALKSLSDVGIDMKFLDDVGEYLCVCMCEMSCTQVKQLALILNEGVSVCLCVKTECMGALHCAIRGPLLVTARRVLGLWMEEKVMPVWCFPGT